MAFATPARPSWPQSPAHFPQAGPSHAPAQPPQPLYPALPAAPSQIAPYNAQSALASTAAQSTSAGALALFGTGAAPRTGSDVLQAAAALVDEQLKGDVAGKIDAAASLGGSSCNEAGHG